MTSLDGRARVVIRSGLAQNATLRMHTLTAPSGRRRM